MTQGFSEEEKSLSVLTTFLEPLNINSFVFCLLVLCYPSGVHRLQVRDFVFKYKNGTLSVFLNCIGHEQQVIIGIG